MSKRVLVVENDPLWKEDLPRHINRALNTATVVVSERYADAKKLLDQEPWDLLVTDIENLGAEFEQKEGGPHDHHGNLLTQVALARRIPTIIVSVAAHTTAEVDGMLKALGSATEGRPYFRAIDKTSFSIEIFVNAVREALALTKPPTQAEKSGSDSNPSNVFICHGRNQQAVEELSRFLRYIGLQPTTFRDVAARMPNRSAVEIVRRGMAEARAVLVLFTPDEKAQLDPKLHQRGEPSVEQSRCQARPNVVFEAGVALAIDPEKTQLITMGAVELCSDLQGPQVVRLSNDKISRVDLRARLSHLGCPVSHHNLDFDKLNLAGDFEDCVT
jgi:predicted nucleotide-binding protein